MLCTVRKVFEAEGRKLQPGEIVDSTSWRLERQLIDQRYLNPTPQAVTGTPARRGRKGK